MKYLYIVISVIIFLIMLSLNFISTNDIFPEIDMGDLSKRFPLDFMPPGITFAISWGLIYLLLSIYATNLIYRIIKNLNKNNKKEAIYFTIINLLNISWILLTSFKLDIFAVLIIFIMFIVLLIIVKKSNKILENIAFGIYLGWITVASFGLSTSLLINILGGENITNSFIFGNIILIFTTIISIIVFKKTKNYYAISWSIIAIIVSLLKLYNILG